MRTKAALLILFLGCLAPRAVAQAPNIQSYAILTFAPGVDPVAGQPLQTTTLPASAVTCNQPPVAPPASVVNPTLIEFDDAAVSGQVCTINLTSSFLVPLPVGTGYVVTLTQTDGNGLTSARSAGSNPFNVAASPGIITNVRVLRK